MIGRTLSHYEILEEINRGGMGIVYRARDVKLKREVAIKVLPPELVDDPDRRRRFILEAQATAALVHPHIATIHEIDEVDGITFIAMELIEGRELGELIAARNDETRLTVARCLERPIVALLPSHGRPVTDGSAMDVLRERVNGPDVTHRRR